MVEVKIIADSVDHRGNRVTTYLTRFTQTIAKELLRHRMFSFSSSSMRAIPAHLVAAELEDDYYIPNAWQKHHPGMQGKEYFKDTDMFNDEFVGQTSIIKRAEFEWEEAKIACETAAENIAALGMTKQNSNRLLETFGYVNILITASEYDNFFELRCPRYELTDGEICFSRKDALAFSCGGEDPKFYEKVKDFTDVEWLEINQSMAEIHIQELAEAMWDARRWTTPKHLNAGEWHIPFGDQMHEIEIAKMASRLEYKLPYGITSKITFIKLMVSAARCARLSYNTFDGEIDYNKDIKLAFMLAEDKHWSPFEHSAQCMLDKEYSMFLRSFIDRLTGNIFLQEGWLANFRGFKQFRQIL